MTVNVHTSKPQVTTKTHEDRVTWDIAEPPCTTCKHFNYCKTGYVCRDYIIYTDTNVAGEVSRVPSRLLYFKHYR